MMKNNKSFKQKEKVKLMELLSKGKLSGTEMIYEVIERKREKFTKVAMTFKVEIKGMDLT